MVIKSYHYLFPGAGNHSNRILQYVLQNAAHLFKSQLAGNKIASRDLTYIFRGSICKY